MNGAVTVNTKVSIGLIVSLIGGLALGTWAIVGAVNGAKSDITTQIVAVNSRLDRHDIVFENFKTSQNDLKDQVRLVQQHKETWSYQDMFKWAVHLQRDNPQVKVPEPEQAKE